MKEIINNKKNIIVISIILVLIIIVSVVLILRKTDASKLDDEKIVKEQEEVINLVKSYVTEEVEDYAKENSKIEFSVKELRGIFNIDVSEFKELKYTCDENTTFIKYNNDYSDYIVVLDCQDFYL